MQAQHVDPPTGNSIPRKPLSEKGEITLSHVQPQVVVEQNPCELLPQQLDIAFWSKGDSRLGQARTGFLSPISHNRQTTGERSQTAASSRRESPSNKKEHIGGTQGHANLSAAS